MSTILIFVNYASHQKIIQYRVKSYHELMSLVCQRDPHATALVSSAGRLINDDHSLRIFAGTTVEPTRGEPYRV